MTTEICINPAEILEGDLMAYVDGTADQTVVRHIGLCPACSEQAAVLARLQAVLVPRLYRRSCPDSEQIIAYRHDELQGGDRLVMAQHLRQCPHCARELAVLTRGDRRIAGLAERTTAADWLRTAVHVVEAALVMPQAQALTVRGVREQARPALQIYRADGIEIIVNLQVSRLHPYQWDVVGLAHMDGQVPETIDEAKAELYRGEGLIAIEPVSSRGQFTFAAVEPAEYDLSLVWKQQEIRMRGIQVR